jgi:hypothetical protein
MPIGLPDNSNSQFNPDDGFGPPVTTLPNPIGNGAATPGDPTGSSTSGFRLPGMDDINNWLTSGGPNAVTNNAARAAALATAYESFRNSRRIQDTAERAADIANPFQPYRRQYGDQLADLYKDPSKIADTPGYKFALQQGIGATERANASQGYLGSGKMSTDLMDYAQGLASQTWDKEANRLSGLAGAQFNPANGADMIMRGEEGGIRERGNALAALGHLLNPGQVPGNGGDPNRTTPNGPDGRGPPGTRGPDGQTRNSSGFTPNQPGGDTPPSQFFGPASQWIQQQIRNGVHVDPNDPHVAEAIREGTPQGYYNGMPDPMKDPAGFDRWQQQQNDDIMNRYGDGSGGGDTPSNPDPFENGYPDPDNPISIDDINFDYDQFNFDTGGFFDP